MYSYDTDASVSIDGMPATKSGQTYSVQIPQGYKEVPFKTISESGKEQNYNLKIYTKDYVLDLDKLIVNGTDAEKQAGWEKISNEKNDEIKKSNYAIDIFKSI